MRNKRDKDESTKPQDKSIRRRLTRTVLIPSVTLLVLWTAVSAYFFVNGLYVRLVAASVREVSIPAATALGELQSERQIALRYLDEREQGQGQAELQAQETKTDKRLAELGSAFDSTISNAPDEIANKVNALRKQLGQLPVVRSQVNFHSIDRKQVNDFYNHILDSASDLFDTQARVGSDATATHGGVTATATFRVGDAMSREGSIIATALTSGQLSSDDFVQFSQLAGYYRQELARIAPYLNPEVRDQYQRLTRSGAWRQLESEEQALLKRGPWPQSRRGSVPVNSAEWLDTTNQVSKGLNDLAINQADKVSLASIDYGNSQLRTAIIGSILALLASLVAIIVAVRVSRSLVDRTLMTRLARLRDDSLDLARRRLPTLVNRLKNGESVDLNAELPQLDHGRDEIGQVAEAFNTAQLTAVNAAASEAKARSGVHNVFLGIAHRNQVLVHQQLQILDEMESREENSTQLASLFQLDHLAARARRTTENLIILGGKQPGRRWRNPVPLMEVLRAAVSETQQYPRVQIEVAADVAIVGSAVADTIHLIAELVDNATTYSPPGTPVEVTSRPVARGVVVDVSDQGLGMKDAVLKWANDMMTEAPEFDAMALRADSSLGLFVVARLAAKLGITVTFDPSRYGGLRATVLLPAQLLAEEGAARNEREDAGHRPAPIQEPAVLAPVGGPAPQVVENAQNPRAMNTSASSARQILARREPAPNAHAPAPADSGRGAPTPARPPATFTPRQPDSPGVAAETKPDRPRLPRREPQQNLVAQLKDEPEDGTEDDVIAGEGTARSLTAFHTGTRRGRHGAKDS